MKFCTVINCMDGRVQLPVFHFLQQRFKVEYVDSITEAGPILVLAEKTNQTVIQSIFKRLEVSVYKHNSVGIAIVGHHDCAGNPANKTEQVSQLRKSIQLIEERYPDTPIIGLWVDENWQVQEIENQLNK